MRYRRIVCYPLLALLGCQTVSVTSGDSFSVEERQAKNLVLICGAGIQQLNSARLAGALENSRGKVGLEFETEFKAAVPFAGPQALDMYREFIGCIRDRATYSLPDGRQYSSKELASSVHTVDTGLAISFISRWFADDDVEMKYDFLLENKSNLPLTCRVRTQLSIVNSYNLEEPVRNIWSDRIEITIQPNATARIPGKLVAEEPRRRSIERIRAFATPLACWRR